MHKYMGRGPLSPASRGRRAEFVAASWIITLSAREARSLGGSCGAGDVPARDARRAGWSLHRLGARRGRGFPSGLTGHSTP